MRTYSSCKRCNTKFWKSWNENTREIACKQSTSKQNRWGFTINHGHNFHISKRNVSVNVSVFHVPLIVVVCPRLGSYFSVVSKPINYNDYVGSFYMSRFYFVLTRSMNETCIRWYGLCTYAVVYVDFHRCSLPNGGYFTNQKPDYTLLKSLSWLLVLMVSLSLSLSLHMNLYVYFEWWSFSEHRTVSTNVCRVPIAVRICRFKGGKNTQSRNSLGLFSIWHKIRIVDAWINKFSAQSEMCVNSLRSFSFSYAKSIFPN